MWTKQKWCLLYLSFLLVGLVLFASRNLKFLFLNHGDKFSILKKTIFLQQAKLISHSPKALDCMEDQFQTKWRGSTNDTSLSSRRCNLCSIYQGRFYNVTKQCKYYHPNTVHYIKYSGQSHPIPVVSFKEYVSIVSVDKFYKPDKIIIHADNIHLIGPYWDRILKTISTPIEVRHTERVHQIDGKKPQFVPHKADYIKLKLAIIEGGLYIDFDVIMLNGTQFRQMQERSELVMGRNSDYCTKTNAGFFSSVPNSSFAREWLYKSYESGDYRPSKWDYNCADVPSKILCRCPQCYDVFISSELSNWRDSEYHRWLEPGGVEWRGRPGIHYMNTGFMKPLKPPEELLRMNTPFTEMIKYVLGDSYKDFL